MNFIAVDFETANSNRSSICSVGFAIVENGQLIGTEHIYIKPTPDYYDGMNTMIHGISHRHTHDKATFKQQWPDLEKYFHNQVMVAHNAAFDCSALRAALDVGGLPYPDMDFHCTYRLAKEVLPLYNHKLNEVSNHFGITLKHHDAESDARACALIALRLCSAYNVDSLEALSAAVGFKTGKIMRETNSYKAFSKRK